jgi:two-component system response regulator RegA
MTQPLTPESGRLLLVDDDVTFCSVFNRALLRHHFSVAVAHAIDQALEVAGRFQPTHAVVDLKLGDDSGLHLIKPLLSLNKGMQIIVLTGYGSIPTAVKAIKEGAGNYLAKPVDVGTILSAFDSTGKEPAEDPVATPMSLRRLEWEYIQRVLAEHDGNISATARSLSMHRRTLQRKLQKRPSKH